MVDWNAPKELQREGSAFDKLMHALLGLYAWEFFLSLDFDWAFISGKKRFRWPLIFYFAGRYCLLFALIGIIIAQDTTNRINCEALYTFNQLSGDAAVGLASINLSIRTMAVWSQNRYIVGILVIIILGHWSLILQGVLLKASWSPPTGCLITHTSNTILAATFIYSMVFDLIVLVLNAWKLLGLGVSVGVVGMGRGSVVVGGCGLGGCVGRGTAAGSGIGRLIFGDGLIFFLIAFLSNSLATVFMLLNLNSFMSVIFNVPAAVASTIVASRAVRRLTNFGAQGPEVFVSSSHQISNNAQFRSSSGGRGGLGLGLGNLKCGVRTAPSVGVHVQMETFTRAEEATERDLDTYHRYEADGDRYPMTMMDSAGRIGNVNRNTTRRTVAFTSDSEVSEGDVDVDVDVEKGSVVLGGVID